MNRKSKLRCICDTCIPTAFVGTAQIIVECFVRSPDEKLFFFSFPNP